MRRRFPLHVAASVVLATAACTSAGTGADGAGDGGAAASPDDPAAESAVEVSVSITDGEITPGVRRVDAPKDSRVRLLVTSDVDGEVHLHGYDIGEALEAGRPTIIEFVASQAGEFAVETHDDGRVLLRLQVG